MSQQKTVEKPDGSIYEWDEEDRQYRCTHVDVNIEDVEVDTMRSGEHDTYTTKAAICANPECEEDLTEDWDFTPDEPDYDDDDR